MKVLESVGYFAIQMYLFGILLHIEVLDFAGEYDFYGCLLPYLMKVYI